MQNQEHLIVYGETEASLSKHEVWLARTPAASVDPAHYRERLLATARERQEKLATMTLTEALKLFPFLCSEEAVSSAFCLIYCDASVARNCDESVALKARPCYFLLHFSQI